MDVLHDGRRAVGGQAGCGGDGGVFLDGVGVALLFPRHKGHDQANQEFADDLAKLDDRRGEGVGVGGHFNKPGNTPGRSRSAGDSCW